MAGNSHKFANIVQKATFDFWNHYKSQLNTYYNAYKNRRNRGDLVVIVSFYKMPWNNFYEVAHNELFSWLLIIDNNNNI